MSPAQTEPADPPRADCGLVFVPDAHGGLVADVQICYQVDRALLESLVFEWIYRAPQPPTITRKRLEQRAVVYVAEYGRLGISQLVHERWKTLDHPQRMTAAKIVSLLFPDLYEPAAQAVKETA